MKNAIYEGYVTHQRLTPKKHHFRYAVNYFFFDLSKQNELITLPILLSFNPKNYLAKEEVCSLIEKKLEASSASVKSVFLLTQLSYFGFCFNPVSFYYCYNENSDLLYIVSLITNTPWGEKHIDCIDFQKNNGAVDFPKNFHVSPFMPMSIHYYWHFTNVGQKIEILMKNQNHNEKGYFFTASMNLTSKELNYKNVLLSILRFPLMSFKTVAGIYWQALILYLKGIPFYSHPKKSEAI
jgi:DUF1365 family protein